RAAPPHQSCWRCYPPCRRSAKRCRHRREQASSAARRRPRPVCGRRKMARARDCAAQACPRPCPCCLHCLDQHGAALSAANALGGDALLDAESTHCVDEVQHNAVAARTHGMTEPDRAAVHIELVARDAPGSTVEIEHLAAERLVLPCCKTCEHLCREGFVQLPQSDIGKRKPLPAHDRG